MSLHLSLIPLVVTIATSVVVSVLLYLQVAQFLQALAAQVACVDREVPRYEVSVYVKYDPVVFDFLRYHDHY